MVAAMSCASSAGLLYRRIVAEIQSRDRSAGDGIRGAGAQRCAASARGAETVVARYCHYAPGSSRSSRSIRAQGLALSNRHHRQLHVRRVIAGVMDRILGDHRLALAFVRATRVEVTHELREVGGGDFRRGGDGPSRSECSWPWAWGGSRRSFLSPSTPACRSRCDSARGRSCRR